MTRRNVLVALALIVAGCGGSSSSSPGDVARATVTDQANGKTGGIWDRAHPDMQARMSKASYVACVTAFGGSPQQVTTKVIEDLPGTYSTTAGAQLDVHAVTVRLTVKTGQSLSEQVWLTKVDAAWRVVQIMQPGLTEDKACLKRL